MFTLSPSYSSVDILPQSVESAGTYTADVNYGKSFFLRDSTVLQKRTVKNKRFPIKSVLALLKSLLLPLVAVGYLSFCFIVHKRVVTINLPGLFDSQSIVRMKGVTTSLSILIISIGLWPLKCLMQDIRSEEFFCTLSARRSGVPLATLNSISTPSFGFTETFMAIIRRHCSSHLTAAFIGGFFIIATGTLAPAALTVQTVLVDGDIVALGIGAVGPNSVYNASGVGADVFNQNLHDHLQQASSIAWAESTLGVQYSFQPQGGDGVTPYIIPTPAGMSTDTPARWISDVVMLSPSCFWAKPNVSEMNFTTDLTPVFDASNKTSGPTQFKVLLPQVGIDVILDPGSWSQSGPQLNLQNLTSQVFNHTTNDPPSDGSSIWLLQYCTSGTCLGSSVTLDLSGIDTLRTSDTNQTWESAFLVCSPNPTFQTQEVRNDGRGFLTVHDDGSRTYQRQGNLHPLQTTMLLSASLNDFSYKSGPQSLYLTTAQGQSSLVFGLEKINANTPVDPTILKPLPLANITTTYTQVVQAATKVFLGSNVLGAAYVPARFYREALIFTSSLPHVIASTGLFGVLCAIILVAHFRSGKGERFTLLAVAAALRGSEIMEHPGLNVNGPSEEEVMALWGESMLSRSVDGVLRLHLHPHMAER